MARLFVTSINLNKNELQNARIQNLSSAPSSPVAGQIYFDTITNIMYFYNGSAWVSTSGSAEVIQDTVDTMIVAGTGLDKTYDDNAGTLTIDIDSTVTTNSGTQTLTNKTFDLTSNTLQGTISEFNTALEDADFATLAGTETLTNKTITGPTVSGLYLSDSSITFEGSSADNNETVLQVTNPTDDRTITLPDLSGTVILTTNKVTDLTAPTSDFSMNNHKITNVSTPTNSTDAANKAYVDAVSEGLHIHASARVYVGTNIDLSTALEAGDIIDGQTLVAGDRVLVNGQTAQSENGIYVVAVSGAASRAADFDTALEIASGDFIFVTAGTNYASTGWVQTLKPATIGTDPISFTQFSGAGTYLAAEGLYLDGNTFKVDYTPSTGYANIHYANNALIIKADTNRGLSTDINGIGINAGTGLTHSAGALTFASGYGVRKHSASVGDGSATSIAVTHSFGTKDVTVHIYENASPYAQVEADIEHTDTNNVTVKFAVAPTTDQYRVVIVG
jgi:hypothetical protein